MKTRKAILYVRVSTDEQADGFSLSYQEERLRKYCALNNIEVAAFYNQDHSAKTFDRPEFKKLLADIKSNKHSADLLLFLKAAGYRTTIRHEYPGAQVYAGYLPGSSGSGK